MSKENVAFVRKDMLEELPAPSTNKGPLAWIMNNLFSTIGNTVMTLIGIYILYSILPPLVKFVFIDGVWVGSDRNVCASVQQNGGIQPNGWFGGCWAYVGAYMGQFIYGRYPSEELWRVNLTGILFFGSLIPLLMPSAPFKLANIVFTVLIFPIIAIVLLTGGHIDFNGFLLPDSIMAPSSFKFAIDFIILTAIFAGIATLMARGSEKDPKPAIMAVVSVMGVLAIMFLVMGINFGLEHVDSPSWGGLLVTLVIAVTGIAAALPLGILLALGRRSNMVLVRLFSVIFIEFWRGVPLITVLFMSSVMLPLFLPDGVEFDKLLRALIGVALFSAAYMAEVVRGGLQALPKGQFEGAQALGLNWGQMTRLIILPQALKLVIPGIVNTFIGLFKDTTLVLIIGLFDFLGTIQLSYADPTWSSPVQNITGYSFAAFIYFIFCYSMSRYSTYMENRLNTSHR